MSPATAAPAAAATAAPAPASAAAPVALTPAAPSASPTYAQPNATDRPYSGQLAESAPPSKPPRHSTGMMVGGIVMVSFVPIALLAALIANNEQNACETGGLYFNGTSSSFSRTSDCSAYDKTIYGGTIGAVVLLGAGIPMIVIGGKRERPEGEARVTPWASPQAAGLKLRLDL